MNRALSWRAGLIVSILCLGIVAAGFIAIVATRPAEPFASNGQQLGASVLAERSSPTFNPPTPAPTPTPGPPIGITPRPYPTLAEPLTEEGALRRALEIDSLTATWRRTPWSLDTPRLEPGRITITWYSDRTYDGSWFGPGAETGPVWVVTIKGDARFSLPGIGFDSRRVYSQVTYIIAQKTGDLLGVRLGPPSEDQPFIPDTPTPSYQPTAPTTVDALSGLSCTENPAGLLFQVSQQPGQSLVPGAAGPLVSFFVRGSGFIPGEKVTIVIKGRVKAPGTMGGTTETASANSTFATSIGAAVVQPDVPFDLFVIHQRGVACLTVTPHQ